MTAAATGLGCGKLYLAGEYAVMTPGVPAVIAGVDRYLTATAVPADRGRVTSAQYDAPRAFWLDDAQGVAPTGWGEPDLVSRALALGYGICAARGATPEPLAIGITSDLDDAATGRKYGLGSSGAVVVAVIDAVTRAHGVALDAPARYRAAMVVTAQHGAVGSGGDIAAAATGGVIVYRRPDPGALRKRIDADPIAAALEPWPDSGIRPLDVDPAVRLLVGWTGRPADTGEQLRRAGAVADPAEAGEAALDLAAALEAGDGAAIGDAVGRVRAWLAELAAERGTVIETERLAALADIATAAGAPGKSSGAGGGDCGIALAAGPVGAAAIHDAWRAAGVTPLNLGFDQRIRGRG